MTALYWANCLTHESSPRTARQSTEMGWTGLLCWEKLPMRSPKFGVMTVLFRGQKKGQIKQKGAKKRHEKCILAVVGVHKCYH